MGTVLDPCQAESRANEKCEEIEEELNKGSGEVFVDIEEVEEFSLAGVIMLASAIERGMRSDARSKKGVRGNVPANEEIRREFNESGFFTWLGLPETQADQERSTWTSARSKKVVSNRAAELVRFARDRISGRKESWECSYKTLLECMTNTHSHAGGKENYESERGAVAPIDGEEQWIAGVMCKGTRAFFAVCDRGVGIAKSQGGRSFFRRMGEVGWIPSEKELLRTALKGELSSASGRIGRGLGIPTMAGYARQGMIENMVIASGRTVAEAGTREIRTIPGTIRGVIVAWEVRGENEQ